MDADHTEYSLFMSVAAFAEATGLPVSYIIGNLAIVRDGKYVIPRFMVDEYVHTDNTAITLAQTMHQEHSEKTEKCKNIDEIISVDILLDDSSDSLPDDNTHSIEDTGAQARDGLVADPDIINSDSMDNTSVHTGNLPQDVDKDSQFDHLYNRVKASSRHLHANPWMRFSARMLDLSISSVLVLIALDALITHVSLFQNTRSNPMILAALLFLVIPAALSLDAMIYAVFKRTLGKSLLGISVLNQHSELLSAGAYLHRNASIWISGFAMMILPVTLLTLIIQYKLIAKEEPSTYDKRTGNFVEADFIGTIHALLFVSCVTIMFVACNLTYLLILKPLLLDIIAG